MSDSENDSSEPAAVKPKIPKAIRLGGIFEQQLNRSREAAKASEEWTTRKLRGELEQWLKNTRLQWKGKEWNYSIEPDPVFGYVLACEIGDDEAIQDFWQEALQCYIHRKPDYDIVLGKLVPKDLRKAAANVIADRAYIAGTNSTASGDLSAYLRQLNKTRRRELELSGVATGFDVVDTALGDGLSGTNFLGGFGGSGKTSLAMHMMEFALAADPNLAVLVLTTDMPKGEWIKRLICRRAGIDQKTVEARKWTSDVSRRFEKAKEELRSKTLTRLRFVEKEALESESLLDDLQQFAQELLENAGANRLFIVLDYFQRLPVPAELGHEDPDQYRVELLDAMKPLGITLRDPMGATILAISEVRKGDSSRTELFMEDLLGSTRLNYSAHAVLLLQNPADHLGRGDVVPRTLKIDKARGGNRVAGIPLLFEHTYYRFRLEGDPGVSKSTKSKSVRTVNPLGGSKRRKVR